MSWLWELRQAAEAAKKAWTGCSWPTEFGSRQLNLAGLCSRQASLAAKATRGDEAACWREAAAWLAQMEMDAAEAAKRAELAVHAAAAGDLAKASQWFEQAARIAAPYPCGEGYQKCCRLCDQQVLQRQ